MRNTLFATSALAFAAVFAAGSVLAADAKKEDEEEVKVEATEMAEAPAEEMAEEAMAEEEMAEAPPPAWTVGVSGYMEQWVGVSDVDGSATHDGITDAQSDTEFNVDASIEADNGLTFRAQIQVEGNAGNNIDESYLSMSGGFGDIRLGAEDDVHAAMHYGVVDVGVGLNHGDVSAWIPGVSSFSTSGWKADRKGLIYFSPRMQGLQVGVSYSGDAGNEAGGTTHNDHDSWAAAANYTGEMAGTSISVSVGHYNAGVTGEHMLDASGQNHLCSMTYTNSDGGNEKYVGFVTGAGNANNASCDGVGDGTGTTFLGANGAATDDDFFVPGLASATSSGDATFTNFGLRVGFGSFGFSFAYADSDSAAFEVVDTPVMYAVSGDGGANYATTAAAATTVLDTANAANAATGATNTRVAAAAGATGVPANAVLVTGAMFNWGTDAAQGVTPPATGSTTGQDALPVNRVVERTQSVVKDMAGETTTMSAGVSFSEGPLGVSIGWTQEEREDNTEAEAVMFSASYTLAPGVAARASIFQAEDGGVDGSAVVGGITLSF